MRLPHLPIFATILAVLPFAYCTSKNYTANFDDTGNFTPPTPVGLYDSLSWVHLDKIFPYLYQGKFIIGILPSSGHIYAAYGSGVTSQLAIPHAMKTTYPGSQTACIDLSSFYYACSASYNANSGAKPISCHVTVHGFKHGNSGATPNVTTTFEYIPQYVNDPASPPNSTATMTKAVLPAGWTGLQTVKFVSKALDFAMYKRPTTYFDDVTYTAYNGTCG